MISKRTYRILVGIIGLLFIAPLLQRNLHLWTFDALKGARTAHKKPAITLESWLNGQYQKDADKYCTDSFGFQSPLVRSINQIDFSLFRQANAQYVVVGKEHYLYETPYIEAHLGMDFLGDSTISEKVKMYKQVHDTLFALGTNLRMIFAPGKGSYFPEYIPDYYQKYRRSKTNYQGFKAGFDNANMPYLDFNAWFRQEKESALAPLFPRTGIHWSKYGMLIATDSILRFWNSNYNQDLPTLHYTMPDSTTKMTSGSDADVEDGLNIYQTLPHFDMVYPSHKIVERNDKITSAVIADSYYWGLFDIGLSTIACDSGEFWYYFKQVYPQNFTSGLMIDDLDLKSAIESKNEILILQTDATLDRFGFGFIEAAHNVYFKP